MENQNKLLDVFGDLVLAEAYSNVSGIDQKTLEIQASIHDALIRIGENNYIRLSSLLLGQLGELKSPGQTGRGIIEPSKIVNTINSIGKLRGITYRLATLSLLKEIKLKETFSKMLQEDDPGKRLDLAHEYRDVYGELDADLKTLEEAEDRLGKLIPEEKKRVDSFLENRKREGTAKKYHSGGEPVSATTNKETAVEDMWTTIGQINVDSGYVMVFDPCHFHSDIHPIQEIVDGFKRGYQIGEGIAVLIPAGLGDGAYDVEALIGEVEGWGERIKEIRVRFVGPGTMYDV